MIFEFIVESRPKSANKPPDPKFTQKIQTAAKLYNTGSPLTGSLYAKIIWFHNGKSDGDTDNIAKRILDSLRTIAYIDDALISHCYIDRIDTSVSYETAGIPTLTKVVDDLSALLGGGQFRHILYVRIGITRQIAQYEVHHA